MSNKPVSEYRFFKELTQLPFVDAIYLYGSRARGDHFERSDIDLAIVCPRASESEWRQIRDIVDQEHVDTLLQIECKRYDTLEESSFKQRLDKDKKLIFSRKEFA